MSNFTPPREDGRRYWTLRSGDALRQMAVESKTAANARRVDRANLRSKSGAKGTRTPDPHTASVVRYQLRHSPVKLCPPKLHHQG